MHIFVYLGKIRSNNMQFSLLISRSSWYLTFPSSAYTITKILHQPQKTAVCHHSERYRLHAEASDHIARIGLCLIFSRLVHAEGTAVRKYVPIARPRVARFTRAIPQSASPASHALPATNRLSKFHHGTQLWASQNSFAGLFNFVQIWPYPVQNPM